MKDYLIVETRDLHDTRDADWTAALAVAFAKKRSKATVFLAENGVLAARAAYDAPMLVQLAKKGVKVFADRFALEERGISLNELAKGIEPAEIDFLAEGLAAGATVIWR